MGLSAAVYSSATHVSEIGSAGYATGRQWAWLSPNDMRRAKNMTPIDNGDGNMQPLNMAPLDSPASVPIRALQSAPSRRRGAGSG
jgi:hypothetical protein